MTIYLLRANSEWRLAESLAELADLLYAAAQAGHRIERTHAVQAGMPRPLDSTEFAELLERATQRSP